MGTQSQTLDHEVHGVGTLALNHLLHDLVVILQLAQIARDMLQHFLENLRLCHLHVLKQLLNGLAAVVHGQEVDEMDDVLIQNHQILLIHHTTVPVTASLGHSSLLRIQKLPGGVHFAEFRSKQSIHGENLLLAEGEVLQEIGSHRQRFVLHRILQ